MAFSGLVALPVEGKVEGKEVVIMLLTYEVMKWIPIGWFLVKVSQERFLLFGVYQRAYPILNQ